MPGPVEFPDLPGWKFTVTERSMSSFQVMAVRESGASIVLAGFDYGALLEEARIEAKSMDSRLTNKPE